MNISDKTFWFLVIYFLMIVMIGLEVSGIWP